MNIIFFAEKTEMPDIDKQKISDWIRQTIKEESKTDGELNIIFCTDEYLQKLNKKHLNSDYYTDIISFDYCNGDMISGDIFISLCRVNENAEKFNSNDTELLRVIIHGVLHLLGYNDANEDEKKIMTEKENEALRLYEKRQDYGNF